ncbi:unnamed protein product, partial [Staurois parvus]
MQGRSPCTSSENTARTGTSVPSTVVISSAGGVPLELMAPARGSAFLCVGGAAARIFVRIHSGTTRTYVNLALSFDNKTQKLIGFYEELHQILHHAVLVNNPLS